MNILHTLTMLVMYALDANFGMCIYVNANGTMQTFVDGLVLEINLLESALYLNTSLHK